MPQTMQVEVWILVDESGDYALAKDEDSLSESYENDIQPVADAGATRRIKVLLTVPMPEAVTLTGVVPAEGEATLSVA